MQDIIKTPITPEQYMIDLLLKSRRHTETNNNIVSNHGPKKYERLFSPYTISRKPIVTHVQSSKTEMWNQVNIMDNAEKTQVQRMQPQTCTQKQQRTSDNPGKVDEGTARTRYGKVVQKPDRLTL